MLAISKPVAIDPRGGVLRFICSKCTRVGVFRAATEREALEIALEIGWYVTDDGQPICRKCPSARPSKYDIPRS